jgi:hypothetical protein
MTVNLSSAMNRELSWNASSNVSKPVATASKLNWLHPPEVLGLVKLKYVTPFSAAGTPAYIVATQIVHHGLGSLSWQQRFVYPGATGAAA